MKELKRFDPILKEIFSKAAGKIISVVTGEKIEEELGNITGEIKLIKSLRPDLLFRSKEKIFHIEIQVQQDKSLPERMLIYSVAIREKFEKFPTQIVLFVGKGNPPPSVFKSEFTIHKFKVVDMKKIDPDEFIKSNKPEEVIVGILAGKYKEKPEVFKKVTEKITEIVKSEREVIKYMNDINFLASLFEVEIKVKPMPIQVDIRKAPFYKWGKEEGEKKGLIKGLKEAILLGVQFKFGRSKVKEAKKLLEKIDDINLLKKIHKKIIMENTWEDFIKAFKNSSSANK